MLTKVATHTVPEMIYFVSVEEEHAYWNDFCSICHNRDCQDDCPFVVVHGKLCESCEGDGIISYVMRPVNEMPYKIITACGMCDGIGLI